MRRQPSEMAIRLEHEALDKIHAELRKKENAYGLTVWQLAKRTGLAIGYLQAVLARSECVLKRRSHSKRVWWADWSELDDGFRPVRKRGWPKGRPRKAVEKMKRTILTHSEPY